MGPRVKDSAGRVKAIAPAEFRRLFQATLCAGLDAPAALPPDYLVRAHEADRRTAAEWGKREHGAFQRRIAAGYTASVYVAKVSVQVGHGLYAYRDLGPGDMIGEYAGTLTGEWVADIKTPSDFNPYLLRYPFECPLAIDAQRKGNVTRFINHSTHQANVRRLYVMVGGLLHAVFVADKAIRKEAQILLDYGQRYWHGREPLEIEA